MLGKGVSYALPLMAGIFAGLPLEGEVVINHEPAACMLAGRFPVIEARVEGSASLRVYFHTKAAPFWSFSEMKAEGVAFRAILPKPAERERELYYYLVATEASGSRTRSQEYLVDVVHDPSRCSDPKRISRSVDSASPLVGRGDPIERVKTAAGGGSGKTIGFAALGAAAVGGGVLALTRGGGGGTPSLQGTFTGTLDGYAQQLLGFCSGTLNVAPGGTISIAIAPSSTMASFTFPAGTFTPADQSQCDPAVLVPRPPVSGQFSQVVVSGNIISGRTVVGTQGFVLEATVVGSTLGGVINVSGGPSGAWSTAVATIHGSKASQ